MKPDLLLCNNMPYAWKTELGCEAEVMRPRRRRRRRSTGSAENRLDFIPFLVLNLILFKFF